MGFYSEIILPRFVDWLMAGRGFQKLRRKCLAGLGGTVLEVGFGSGHNLPFYPAGVDKIFAVDPSKLGRKLARQRLAETSIPVEFLDLDGKTIPLEEGSVDCVLTTWTLCTIPDVEKALTEMHRVLKRDGKLHFMEHGRANEASIARWQDRLNPIQKLVAGGCHLNRRMDELILASGLTLSVLENFYMRGPKIGTFMYGGVATKNHSKGSVA